MRAGDRGRDFRVCSLEVAQARFQERRPANDTHELVGLPLCEGTEAFTFRLQCREVSFSPLSPVDRAVMNGARAVMDEGTQLFMVGLQGRQMCFGLADPLDGVIERGAKCLLCCLDRRETGFNSQRTEQDASDVTERAMGPATIVR